MQKMGKNERKGYLKALSDVAMHFATLADDEQKNMKDSLARERSAENAADFEAASQTSKDFDKALQRKIGWMESLVQIHELENSARN